MIAHFFWLGSAAILCLQWADSIFSRRSCRRGRSRCRAGSASSGPRSCCSWASELAQLDMPQALALAFLALVAVLPEYAVDMYFAWMAGKDPQYTAYATANMTGANRS
jgi:hypothetical protein